MSRARSAASSALSTQALILSNIYLRRIGELLFPGITIVWKRRRTRGHGRTKLFIQVGCANSTSPYVQFLFLAKLFDVMNYVENTLQGYEIMSYSKLRAIVLFQTIEITSKKIKIVMLLNHLWSFQNCNILNYL